MRLDFFSAWYKNYQLPAYSVFVKLNKYVKFLFYPTKCTSLKYLNTINSNWFQTFLSFSDQSTLLGHFQRRWIRSRSPVWKGENSEFKKHFHYCTNFWTISANLRETWFKKFLHYIHPVRKIQINENLFSWEYLEIVLREERIDKMKNISSRWVLIYDTSKIDDE